MLNKSLPGQQSSVGYKDHVEIGHRRPQWLREFDEVGADAVRDGLRNKKWPDAKKVVAREWLETLEMQAWQAKNATDEDTPYFRDKKWYIYIIAGVFIAFALVRLTRYL